MVFPRKRERYKSARHTLSFLRILLAKIPKKYGTLDTPPTVRILFAYSVSDVPHYQLQYLDLYPQFGWGFDVEYYWALKTRAY